MKKLSTKSLFYKVGEWYVPTNKFEEPEAASIRIASWLQNYYVETMIDHPNRVIFTVTEMVREKNSPFNLINFGELTFRKVIDAPYLEIEYRINMAKTAVTLFFAPLNQEYALRWFKSIIFEGLTKDPIIMSSKAEKFRLTRDQLLIIYVVIAPIIAGLIEMLCIWQDLPVHPATADLLKDEGMWIYDFGGAVFYSVGLLSTWMILLWIYIHEHRDTLENRLEKNKQDLMILIATILLLWITIIWAIYRVYINISSTFSLWSINLPTFSLEYWMGGICLIWALGFSFLFMRYFKG